MRPSVFRPCAKASAQEEITHRPPHHHHPPLFPLSPCNACNPPKSNQTTRRPSRSHTKTPNPPHKRQSQPPNPLRPPSHQAGQGLPQAPRTAHDGGKRRGAAGLAPLPVIGVGCVSSSPCDGPHLLTAGAIVFCFFLVPSNVRTLQSWVKDGLVNDTPSSINDDDREFVLADDRWEQAMITGGAAASSAPAAVEQAREKRPRRVTVRE